MPFLMLPAILPVFYATLNSTARSLTGWLSCCMAICERLPMLTFLFRRLLELVRDTLIAANYTFDAAKKEFVKDNVPVHLVTSEQVRFELGEYIEIDNIRTVSLADLISMKLETGSNDPLRAQDLADVIGLIRQHHLTGEFSPRIKKSVRKEFQKLIKAIGTSA